MIFVLPSFGFITNVCWLDEGNPQNYGFFYTGAVIDYTKTEPIIYRPPSDDGSIKFLRTPQYDTDWLSGKLLMIVLNDKWLWVFLFV